MTHTEAQSRYSLVFNALETLIIFLTVFLVNSNALTRFRQFPEVEGYSDNETSFIIVAILVVLCMILMLSRFKLLQTYLAAWKIQWPLLLFLLYCTISLSWSVYPPATLYKLFFLFFSTIAGAYIAIRYRLQGTLRVLSWVGAICALLSIFLVVYFPFIGVMQTPRFIGSWTGIFWHRNHTGNIFAFFSAVFLLRLLWDSEGGRPRKVLLASLYLLTTAIAFGSRSATGIIVFLFLHIVIAVVTLWLKFYQRMSRWHYYWAGGLLLAGLLLFLTNTSFFFGLLGRSATMTGRIPLWQDLFQRVYLQQPILGYGYGALWMQRWFRFDMMYHNGWGFQVFFADNGFFDILLNTGLVGFLLFLSVYLLLGARSFQQAVREKSWISFLPLITFAYILIANVAYSFMLEVDQFVWMLLVIMLFLTNSPSRNNIPQP